MFAVVAFEEITPYRPDDGQDRSVGYYVGMCPVLSGNPESVREVKAAASAFIDTMRDSRDADRSEFRGHVWIASDVDSLHDTLVYTVENWFEGVNNADSFFDEGDNAKYYPSMSIMIEDFSRLAETW